MKHRWQENFVSYQNLEHCYIYCDTNASYASIHQFLEDGRGRPCVVANGNIRGKGDAGACLAISYEARSAGLKRGSSLKKAKDMVKDLVVYESCLPLYDMYAQLYDDILEWIVPKSMWYRGSCDEIVIDFDFAKLPYRNFLTATRQVIDYIKTVKKCKVNLRIGDQQLHAISNLSPLHQSIYTVCYLLRDVIKQVLGLPISIAVAPTVSLSKMLIDQAKPIVVGQRWSYNTFHPAISFPHSGEEANLFLRKVIIGNLCGVRKVSKRLDDVGVRYVRDVQDDCGLDRTIALARNKHLGKVIWYSCHGRDDVLPGYLAAIKDKK